MRNFTYPPILSIHLRIKKHSGNMINLHEEMKHYRWSKHYYNRISWQYLKLFDPKCLQNYFRIVRLMNQQVYVCRKFIDTVDGCNCFLHKNICWQFVVVSMRLLRPWKRKHSKLNVAQATSQKQRRKSNVANDK